MTISLLLDLPAYLIVLHVCHESLFVHSIDNCTTTICDVILIKKELIKTLQNIFL